MSAAKPEIGLWWGRLNGADPLKKRNFGDEYSRLIVEAVSGCKVNRCRIDRADMVAVGSILSRAIAKNYATHGDTGRKPLAIWGSGLMRAEQMRDVPFARYLAVRGQKTLEQIPVSDVPLGDAGLLARAVREPAKAKQFSLGVVPHHSDLEASAFQALVDRIPNAKLLNICTEDPEFLVQLSTCDMIASSSLHGLIFADAYNIPSVWLEETPVHYGKGFKFFDHFSAVDRPDVSPVKPAELTSLEQIAEIANLADQTVVETRAAALAKALKDHVEDLS
ncbi:polysaccharide pyruvyl transferase family protein [Shimia sediminis]|uniref:polysaccharide pyruvyl transferase family protein n=1 Tax=Shimia sediminis TaxID=2497945 RepID=UPI000F8EF978|nr:polysaccharide pyruvyl transferase family protein [Shimia sediminis]